MKRTKKFLIAILLLLAVTAAIKLCGGPGDVNPIIDTIVYNMK